MAKSKLGFIHRHTLHSLLALAGSLGAATTFAAEICYNVPYETFTPNGSKGTACYHRGASNRHCTYYDDSPRTGGSTPSGSSTAGSGTPNITIHPTKQAEKERAERQEICRADAYIGMTDCKIMYTTSFTDKIGGCSNREYSGNLNIPVAGALGVTYVNKDQACIDKFTAERDLGYLYCESTFAKAKRGWLTRR